jgi:hypothetical protein
MVAPPPDVGNQANAATATRATASTAERGAPPPSAAAPALDRADIKPLDVPGALQILVAEVRAAFELLLTAADTANPADAGNAAAAGNAAYTANAGTAATANLDGPVPAARVLVQMVLQALPDTTDDNAWSAVLTRVEAALQSGIQRATDVVSAWRDVSPAVMESTKESAGLALQLLGDESRNPLWLHPEWSGLRPHLARLRRRRRKHRRRLTDPDHDPARWDEIDDFGQ